MAFETVYVTVGTTKFDELIQMVISDLILNVLKSRGCKKLILQIGTGKEIDCHKIVSAHQILVEQYDFKIESPRFDIVNSDLIIGHAGAGTCFDILKQHKPGLIVVNEKLMSNHQSELAEQLAKDGHIFYCTLETLAKNLKTLDTRELRPYYKGQGMTKFVSYLNALMDRDQ